MILWGDSADAQQLFIMQKKCVRIIANIRIPNSCRPVFTNYKLLTLPSIYILEVALFVRNYPDLFPKKLDDHKTRSQYRNKLMLPKSNLAMFKKGPHYKCILIYNKIPDVIKLESDDRLFKIKLKTLLIRRCYYSVKEFLNDETLKSYDMILNN